METSLTLNLRPNGDRRKLQAALEAQLAYEKMQAVRMFFVHGLALLGGFVWVDAVWPALLSAETHSFIFLLWGACGALTLATVIGEWLWRQRWERCLAEYQTSPGKDNE
jgi:hypothetical protein